MVRRTPQGGVFFFGLLAGVVTMKGYVILENGKIFEGTFHGEEKEVLCELVFTTGMTGYAESVSDPSFEGQALVLTYPMIGNYGFNSEDTESDRPWISALIVRELSIHPSNYRSTEPFGDYLARHGVPVVSGVDTRAITRELRTHGTMNALVTSSKPGEPESRLKEIKNHCLKNSVLRVSRRRKEVFGQGESHIALLDFGAKDTIIRSLVNRGCTVTVWPWDTPAGIILDSNPDGIMISNGPGNPQDCSTALPHIRELMESLIPMFSICLGHQLVALAAGFKTERLPFGHRGANHPVKDIETGRIYLSSQNHGYCVVSDSVNQGIAQISHINVNDGTVEGLRFKNIPVSTVQFHPEASPGPRETAYLFDDFLSLVDRSKTGILLHGEAV